MYASRVGLHKSNNNNKTEYIHETVMRMLRLIEEYGKQYV